MSRRPTSPSLRRFTDRLSATPALAFAVGTNSLFVKFGFALTAGDLAPADWDITIASNGGAPVAQTTTGSVATADGLVVLGVSGTPFKLPPEEEQAITLTYTPANTQTDLKDAAGRDIAGFTYNSIFPRISDWRKAAYLLMAEQGSAPSTPASGYGAIYIGADQDLHFVDDLGTDSGMIGVATAFYNLVAAALLGTWNGTNPFDPGPLFTEQVGDPATPAAGTWMAFFKAGGLSVIDDTGAVTGPFGTGGADGLGPDGDKGDVTVGGTGTTLTIDNNAVTYGKMQDMTTDRLLGRDTAGSGDPEELTVGGGIEFTGTGIQRSALTGAITASAGSGATSQVFSKGGTMVNSSGLSALTAIAWRAPFACTVTNVRGYRVGGSAATINARRNGTDNHLASALSLGSADAWADGGAVQNTAYAAGDKLEIMLVSVTGATQIAIQVDFTRP